MRILLMVPLWHRPEIVEMFVKCLERTTCPYAEVSPYFILSPEDEYFSDLCTLTNGYERTMIKNEPFGHKKNEGLKRALSFDWDYLMELNSDTMFTGLLWTIHESYLNEGVAFFGLKNIYIYEPYQDKAVFCEGYHLSWRDDVTALGPGRCIRRDVVERCIPLWDETAPFGMDGHSDFKITNMGYDCTVIDNGLDPVICDVKGSVCLTSWYQWEECGVPADVNFVRDSFNLSPFCCMKLNEFDQFHNAVLKASYVMKKNEAFKTINEIHKRQTGQYRYSSFESYCTMVKRKHGK